MEDIFDNIVDLNTHEDNENNATEKVDKNKPTSNNKKEQRTVREAIRSVRNVNLRKLSGPRGISHLLKAAEQLHLQGKGQEKEDLNKIIYFYFIWTYRLAPQMKFKDCINEIEKQGKKMPVKNFIKRLKLGTLDETNEDTL